MLVKLAARLLPIIWHFHTIMGRNGQLLVCETELIQRYMYYRMESLFETVSSDAIYEIARSMET